MNYTKDLCSIVCITYNHEKFSKKSLESILNQTYQNIEIVVIDDGSTDNNLSLIEETLKKSNIPHHIIAQKNTGNIPLNFNRALEKITGEYFTVLSLDDTLEPFCLFEKIPFFQKDSNLSFVANDRVNIIDEEGYLTKKEQLNPIANQSISSIEDLIETEYKFLHTFYTQGTLFKTEVIDAIGRYSSDMIGGDINLRTKLFFHMKNNPHLTFKILKNASINYRFHSSNIHKDVLRQSLTVLQWWHRFFPERPMSKIINLWIVVYLQQATQKDPQALLDSIERYPDIKRVYEKPYTKLKIFLFPAKRKLKRIYQFFKK